MIQINKPFRHNYCVIWTFDFITVL